MSEIKHKHVFSRLDFIPRFCWQCGVAEIDGTFYYPSFQFDKLKEQNEKLKEALNDVCERLALIASSAGMPVEGSSYKSDADSNGIVSALNRASETLKSCE